MRQSFDEIRSENQLVSDVFFHLTCESSNQVRTQINQAIAYGRYGKIDSSDVLFRVTQDVDQIIINQYTDDYVNSIELNALKICEKCKHEFQPENASHKQCRPCFLNATVKNCTECGIHFYAQNSTHKYCRECFVKIIKSDTDDNSESSDASSNSSIRSQHIRFE